MKNINSIGGCAFWLIVVVSACVFCVLSAASSPMLEPLLSAQADDAAARRAKERAAESQAEAALVLAEAQAEAFKMFVGVSKTAIDTDRRHAHPLAWIWEIVSPLLVVLVFLFVIAVLMMAVGFYRRPDIAKELLANRNGHEPEPQPVVTEDEIIIQ